MERNKITWEIIEHQIATGQAESLTNEVLGDFPYENTGNEFMIPPWSNILQLSNVIPMIIFFLFFRMVANYVKENLWNDANGFRQYRLRNLSICWLHSLISGTFALWFAIIHTDAMFGQPMHWYKPWTRYGLLLSISYFIHDAIDMLQFEVSRFTIELMLHHLSSIFCFVAAVTSRKFVPFAYCALLMEVNSIFLHSRTLMQLSKNSTKYPMVFRIIQLINIVTFIPFRFVNQTWQLLYVIRHHNNMNLFFAFMGYGGCITFYIINGFLFMRMLAADGFLGDFGRKHAAINRDEAAEKKE